MHDLGESMGQDGLNSRPPVWARLKGRILSPLGILLIVGMILLSGSVLFVSHGTIEARGFCNTCHTAYYDSGEYAFNDKVGMKKPAGILTGCAECHPQPYAEFKRSAHFATQKAARRPGCPNCHNEPHSIRDWYAYMYWQPAAWTKVQLAAHDDVVWEQEVRPDLAAKARTKFAKSNSGACHGCHSEAAKTWRADIKAHKQAVQSGKTCIKCHFNLVHGEVPWPDKDKQ
ncbi:MAG: NapC/NirT family cytochrome c [Rhodocyclales bacterium]|nr:NapC/NirT family cytochrome c [Rhodocyclales bacterium]